MRIGVLGAGSIGCYVGAHLIQAGHEVVLIGRDRLRAAVAADGLHISTTGAKDFHLPAARVRVATSVAAAADCELILVTVKSADTAAAAGALAALPHPGRSIVSLQNGLHNAAVLRTQLPGDQVLAAMVPWNVVWREPAHFHRGTSGVILLEAAGPVADRVVAVLRAAGLATRTHAQLANVLWGKLLLNLNNPINALCGLPLRQQLAERGYRLILSALMREALALMAAAGIRPAKAAALPPRWLPTLLRMPDAIFLRLASAMLKLDPQARSSMAEDMDRGRATEIDYINGEVVRLAASIQRTAPLNAALVALVHAAEATHHSPRLSANALAQALGLRGDC